MKIPSAFKVTRRKFLIGAGVCALGGTGYTLARDMVKVGMIGTGKRANHHLKIFENLKYFPIGCDLVAVCDVDEERLRECCANYCPNATPYTDYRKLIARDDIEAVFITTPEHWHVGIAIEAMLAGKAVYCEKPLSLTIPEGRLAVDVQRRTGAVFQLGTQQRSNQYFRTAGDLVLNGRIGEVNSATVFLGKKKHVPGPFPAQPIPSEFNWDFFLGPTPYREYHIHRRTTSNFWATGGGQLTNWGSHHLDIAQWALGKQFTGPVEIEGDGELPNDGGFEVPTEFDVTFTYVDGTKIFCKTCEPKDNGIQFHGSGGDIFVSRTRLEGEAVSVLVDNPLPDDAVRLDQRYCLSSYTTVFHILDFLRCIRSGAAPISDAESAHRAASLGHLANLSIRLGRQIRFDPDAERILGDDEAAGMISRVRREEYPLPGGLS